ncbi:MAG: PilZ domain-containing protein [candidate division Zixibacteria bacterium]|nr:PilZ domain-containing protein [candidate division Zixibacteria bacterium]
MTQDHRTLKRWQLTRYPAVVDAKTNRVIGRVADINTEGLRLIGPEPVQADGRRKLKLILPTGSRRGTEVTFVATSVWTGRDINPDLHATGMKFRRISPEDVRNIEYLVMTSSFRD